MKITKNFIIILLIALLIKLSLFIYAEIFSPQAKFQFDTDTYLNPGINLVQHGIFARQDENGNFQHELLRVPGYPLFLGILHKLFRIPFYGIIIVQIFSTILAAFITYKAASVIHHSLGYPSALIILFDPTITIFSSMLLAEALFLLLMSLFMFIFILYLKEVQFKYLLLSALVLVMAVYVRPAAYYLGIAISLFIIYAAMCIHKNLKKSFIHAIAFFMVTYTLIGIWHFRNYQHSKENIFSSTNQINIETRGISTRYCKENYPVVKNMPLPLYYLNTFSRSFLSLMARPASLKDFNKSKLKIVIAVISYVWIGFWLAGFLKGISKVQNNIYFIFLLLVISYFIFGSICSAPWAMGPRYRIPMMPFIAIISAHGWLFLKKRKSIRPPNNCSGLIEERSMGG